MLRISCSINFLEKITYLSQVMQKHVNSLTILLSAKIEPIQYIATFTKIVIHLNITINVVKCSCASEFRKYEPLSLAGLEVI